MAAQDTHFVATTALAMLLLKTRVHTHSELELGKILSINSL